jgi:hypothetical protein
MCQQQLLQRGAFSRLNTWFSATTSAFHLLLVNNSLYFSLPLYPFFVSRTENKKGSRDRARCNEVLANSLPANISAFRPSVAEKGGASTQQLLSAEQHIL